MNNCCKESIFAKMYKDYAPIIRNYLYYKFGNMQNAEDVTQNAFIKLWENCERIKPEKAKSFLFVTATNLSLNSIKHEKVVLKYRNIAMKRVQNETPEFQLLEKEFQDKVMKAIEDLSVKQREVFLLNRIEKIKYKEIADLLNISVKAVEKRMHAALIKVRKTIGNV